MPFISKITTLSFKRESLIAAGGMMIVKNILLLVTFLSLLAGLILIGGGAYEQIQASKSDVIDLTGSLSIAAILIGIFISVISFLGCFGAANDKGVLLKTYAAMLLLLIILELSVGIAAYAKKNEIPILLEKAWESAYSRSKDQIMSVEITFQCCGFNNATDKAWPEDCAKVYPTYTSSCFSKIKESINSSLGTLGATGIALGIIQFIGLFFSALLFKFIAGKNDQEQSLLSEAWRINRNKVQYGYQNYQYA